MTEGDSQRQCVIAAIDGSPLSRPVGILGVRLAAGLGWGLILLHVVGSHVLSGSRATYVRASVPEEGAPAYYPVTDKALHEELRDVSLVAEEISKMAEERGVKSKFMILEGDPVSTLLREAEKYGGIIVVGYRGRHFREAGIGSVARALLDKSKIPVVIVPPTTGATDKQE